MIRTWLGTLLLAACLALVAGSPAVAHTGIVSAEPAEGATLDSPPDEVRLGFADPVEAEFSPLEVYDGNGRRVDRDDARLDSEDPNSIVVSLREDLRPGSYEVRYRYTGEDGHTLNGSYEFAIRAAPETTAADAGGGETTAEPTAAPREETTGSVAVDPASNEEGPGGGLARIMLFAGLGIVALAAVAMFVLRGRRGAG